MNPASGDAQNLVKRIQEYITQNLYTCTNKILRGLGKMYSGGGDITTNFQVMMDETKALVKKYLTNKSTLPSYIIRTTTSNLERT